MSLKPHTTDSTPTDSFVEGAGSTTNFFGTFPGPNTSSVSGPSDSPTAQGSSNGQAAPSLNLNDFSFVSAVLPSTAVATTTTKTTSSTSPITTPAVTSSTTSATSLPSWIKSLSTASIATDMAAADVNGTVSYAGLLKLFNDLDSKLGSTKLTAAEMADLKTIAANLNNGMSTSSYLTGITQALVNGNAANATWTGGGASATTLGNLATGSSATQLAELTGKWFMGTDLPSSKVT